MKKLICALIVVTLFTASSALAMNRDRFLDEPGNMAFGPSIMYGMSDMMQKAGGNPGGLMLMIYGTISVDNVDLPMLAMMFGADSFVATSAQIETDLADYTILSTGNIGLIGVKAVNQVSNILTTPDMAEVYRSITESKKVKITLMGDGRKYNFKLTEAQKKQLSLVVAEYDEEIAKYLDASSSDYNAKLASMYKLAGPSIGVTRKHTDKSEESASTSGEYKTLKPGSNGQSVLDARIKLFELGYFSKMPTRTDYTNDMANYVKKFEKDNGLYPDGILSPEDQEVLFSL